MNLWYRFQSKNWHPILWILEYLHQVANDVITPKIRVDYHHSKSPKLGDVLNVEKVLSQILGTTFFGAKPYFYDWDLKSPHGRVWPHPATRALSRKATQRRLLHLQGNLSKSKNDLFTDRNFVVCCFLLEILESTDCWMMFIFLWGDWICNFTSESIHVLYCNVPKSNSNS